VVWLRKKNPTIIKILELLIYQGPQTIEQIADQINKHYTTAMRRTKEMMENMWILDEVFAKSLEEDPRPVSVDGAQRYVVTELGIVVYFLLNPETAFARFGEIAERHPKKFHVFKWYRYFVAHGLGEAIKHRFRIALLNTKSDAFTSLMLSEETMGGDDLLRFVPLFSVMERLRVDRVTFGFNNFVDVHPKSFEIYSQSNAEEGFSVTRNPFFVSYETALGRGYLMDILRVVDLSPELSRLRDETVDSYLSGLEYMKHYVEE